MGFVVVRYKLATRSYYDDSLCRRSEHAPGYGASDARRDGAGGRFADDGTAERVQSHAPGAALVCLDGIPRSDCVGFVYTRIF